MPTVHNQLIDQEDNVPSSADKNNKNNEISIPALPEVHNEYINQEENISSLAVHNSEENGNDIHNTDVDSYIDNIEDNHVAISNELSHHLDRIEQIFIQNFPPEKIFPS